MSVGEDKPTRLTVMGGLRVVQVLSRGPPVVPQVSNTKTAAPPIVDSSGEGKRSEAISSFTPRHRRGANSRSDAGEWVSANFGHVTLTAVSGFCGVGTGRRLVPPGYCLKDLGVKSESPP